MLEEERDEALDKNLSRLLADGSHSPTLEPERRAEMLDALKAKQLEIAVPRPAKSAPAAFPVRWSWLAATAAVLLAGAGLWRLAGTGKPPPIRGPKEKPFPEQARGIAFSQGLERKTLADGSIVIAREGSEYTSDAARSLKLVKGDLYLIVARSEKPFVVKTEHGEARATGTRFAVSASGDTQVAVAQGAVRLVSPLGQIELKRGQQGRVGAAGKPTRSPAPRVSFLVNWARDALSQPERLVEKKKQSGELVAVDPWGQETRLALRKYHVDVNIEDGIARTTVDQTFFNHVPWNIEGTFYFPLPPDASVSRLAMYVNGKLMEGGMVDRSRGQAIYTQIVFQRRDPALLEMMEGNLFKLRIFPIEGRQEKRIFISYTQKLEELYGTQRYWFPMEHTHSVARELAFHVRVKDGAGRFSPASSTHELKVDREGSDLVLDYKAKKAKPDQDFLLHLLPAEQARRSSFAALDKDGFQYVFARMTPELEGEVLPKPRQWIVLNDVSASRSKIDIQAQAHILRRWIAEADDGDTIALINADTGARLQSPSFVSVRAPEALMLAEAAAVSHTLGGTNLGNAFVKVADLIRKHQFDNPHLLYLGDGVATDGRKTVDELLHQLPQGATFIGIGVGKKADARFLQAAADETGGTFTLMNPDEDLDWRVFDLMAALNTPRLVGLEAHYETATGQSAKTIAYPNARSLA
ncbi:MAG: VIT domain-containing protein, partial [Planctomycetota bacterium]|nr:VIT domain-containing protein [Planctomycetota bacterium]